MASCKTNDYNRVVEWSYVDRMFGLPLENPELFQDNPDAPMDDFLYEDGRITLSPDPEKARLERIAELERNLSDTDYFSSQIVEEFINIFSDEPKTLIDVIKIMVDMIKWAQSARAKFGSMLEKREAWRTELVEISNGVGR